MGWEIGSVGGDSSALGEKAVGSIVKIKVGGVLREFIVVQQGKPSSDLYDSSCDGTWLLMKDCYEEGSYAETLSHNYAKSRIHSELNSTFLNLIDAPVRSQIREASIPYDEGYRIMSGG